MMVAPALIQAAKRDADAGEQGLRGAYAAALVSLEEQLEAAREDLRQIKIRAETAPADWPVWQLPNEIAHMVSIALARGSNPASRPTTVTEAWATNKRNAQNQESKP